jgi:hypothetical protein
MKRLPFAAALLAAASLSAAPAAVHAQQPPPAVRAAVRNASGAVTVPITLKGGHIFLDAAVNGKPVRLVFDSGAGANVLTPEAAARLGIASDGTAARAEGAGGSVAISRGVVEKLAVGGDAVLEGELAYFIPLPTELECDGLIGSGLLRRFVATIDYEKSTLTLADPKRFKAPAGADSLPLTFDNNLPAVEGVVEGIPGKFRLDTGANDALTLFTPFVEEHKLRDRYPNRIESLTGKGVGGFLYGDLVRVGSLKLGGAELTGVISELSRQKDGIFTQKGVAGNIGAEVLSRFTVTLDYPSKKLYLARNARFRERFSGSRSGLGLDYGQGKLTVVSVVPGSPGDEAGVKVGDTILSIDGVGLDKIDAAEARRKLRGPAATKVELLVRTGDGGTPRKATVTLRELL